MDETLDYAKHYRQWHDDSDAHAEKVGNAFLAKVRSYLPADRSEEVLEIGCGMGFAMLALLRAGYEHVQGVDVDTSQVEACKRRHLDVEKISDLGSYLVTRPGRYGLVVMFDVLEHLPVSAQVSVMRAVYAAMKPGARILIQVPNATSILAARWRYTDYTHTTCFTEHSLRFVLANAGFEEISIPDEEKGQKRPSLRPGSLRDKSNQWYIKHWLIRWFWRKVLEAEMPGEDVSSIPLTPNLFCIARRLGAEPTSQTT